MKTKIIEKTVNNIGNERPILLISDEEFCDESYCCVAMLLPTNELIVVHQFAGCIYGIGRVIRADLKYFRLFTGIIEIEN